MICDSCGYRLSEDDEIEYTGGGKGVTRPVKVLCPNCDHIQYGRYTDFDADEAGGSPYDDYFDESDSD